MNVKALVILTVTVIMAGAVLVPVVDLYDSDGDDTLVVAVIGGQSNAAYVYDYMDLDVVNDEIPQPSTNCYYYGIDACPVSYNLDRAQCSLHLMTDSGAWKIGGEEAAIAYEISSHTNADVLVVNVGIPAQAISYFEPGADGGDYIEEVLTASLALIPSHYDVVKAGWMWCQGESDDDTLEADYIASFESVQSIFTDYGFTKCYMVQTRSADSGNAYEAQATIAATFSNVVMASTAPESFSVSAGTLIDGNSLHYSQAGRDIVGSDVGEAMANALPVFIRSGDSTALLAVIPVFVIIAILAAVTLPIYNKTD